MSTRNNYKLFDYVAGTADVEKTYGSSFFGIKIYNDGAAIVTLNIQGFAIVIGVGETLEMDFDGKQKLDLEATTAFRCILFA